MLLSVPVWQSFSVTCRDRGEHQPGATRNGGRGLSCLGYSDVEARVCSQSIRLKIFESAKKGPESRTPQSRRGERPRSSRSACLNRRCANNRSSASVLKIVGGPTIYAPDALERQLLQRGCDCTERELLGRSPRRDLGGCDFRRFRRQPNMRISSKIKGKERVGRSSSATNQKNYQYMSSCRDMLSS